jgi:hypothetical protein
MFRRQRLATLSGVLFLLAGTSQVLADSWWRYWANDWFIRQDSKDGLISPETERLALEEVRNKYYEQHPNLKDRVATINIGGQGDISGAQIGETVDVTFSFLEAGGPAVSAVRYEVNVDPSLDLTDPGSMQLLGVSTDAANQFKFSWTIAGFEPLILATPLDAFGNVIFTEDYVTGDYPAGAPTAFRTNISAAIGTVIPVPAPSAGMAGLGLMGLMAGGRVLGRRRYVGV